MDRVGVVFDGTSVGAIAAAKETVAAIDKVKLSVDEQARNNIVARAEERKSLEALAAQYTLVAERAAKGSEVQVAAAQLAADAQKKLAVTTVESADASSGAFRGMGNSMSGLGRSMVVTSAAFVGIGGFAWALKSSIDVVLASQTSIVLLDRAVTNAHASVKALTPILNEQAAAARLLGFNDNDTRDAEAKLVTAFGATKKALDELNQAENLARASSIPLADAAKQLILLQEGNARAAKQFGIVLPDLTKAQWEAKAAADGLTLAQEKGKVMYDELLPRIKAQAAAYAASPAGKIAEFHAEVQHLQESIGTGLLPVVDKYLTEVDAWLAKSDNQKKVTDDVKKVVDELAAALRDAKTATEDVLKVAEPVVKALGGWKSVIEDLVALKLAATIFGWAGAVGKFGLAIKAIPALLGEAGLAGSIGLFMANPEIQGSSPSWVASRSSRRCALALSAAARCPPRSAVTSSRRPAPGLATRSENRSSPTPMAAGTSRMPTRTRTAGTCRRLRRRSFWASPWPSFPAVVAAPPSPATKTRSRSPAGQRSGSSPPPRDSASAPAAPTRPAAATAASRSRARSSTAPATSTRSSSRTASRISPEPRRRSGSPTPAPTGQATRSTRQTPSPATSSSWSEKATHRLGTLASSPAAPAWARR
jgi:hypothetical protein